MALTNRLVLTRTSGGGTVGLHGATGVIHLSQALGARFRRPVAQRAGYQRLGADVQESPLDYWHALADGAAAKTMVDLLDNIAYEVFTVAYTYHTNLRCVGIRHELRVSRACRGPIITGTTQALWRIEGTIVLEHAPA